VPKDRSSALRPSFCHAYPIPAPPQSRKFDARLLQKDHETEAHLSPLSGIAAGTRPALCMAKNHLKEFLPWCAFPHFRRPPLSSLPCRKPAMPHLASLILVR
jgi:hypothetical protein